MLVSEIESHKITQDYTIWLENGIVFIDFEPNTILDDPLLQKLIRHRKQTGIGLLLPTIINIDHLSGLHHKTLLLLIREIDRSSTIAKAIIGTTPKAVIISHLVVNFSAGMIATKSFHSILQANKWIKNYQLYKTYSKSL